MIGNDVAIKRLQSNIRLPGHLLLSEWSFEGKYQALVQLQGLRGVQWKMQRLSPSLEAQLQDPSTATCATVTFTMNMELGKLRLSVGKYEEVIATPTSQKTTFNVCPMYATLRHMYNAELCRHVDCQVNTTQL